MSPEAWVSALFDGVSIVQTYCEIRGDAMDLTTRLDLSLRGYTPDMIGLLTQIFNRRIKISESKIRELLGIPVSEELDVRSLNEFDRAALKAAADKLVPMFSARGNPGMATVAKSITNYFTNAGVQIDQLKVNALAGHIVQNWDDLAFANDDEQTHVPDEMDGDELWGRMSDVPSLKKPSVQGGSTKASSIPY